MGRPIRILLFSTLYPNCEQNHHGIFVENRLRKLIALGGIEVKVVAPVPWFPFQSGIFGSYSKMAAVPAFEKRNGVDVVHPRYFRIPKIGMSRVPRLLAGAGLRAIQEIIDNGFDFDIIDAHYFYPDGVAAVHIGQKLNKPVVITARGTDINLIPQFEKPREQIKWAIDKSAAMVTVCQALKDSLIDLGAESEKVTVLRNGVDLEFFVPGTDRETLRQSLGMTRKSLISVGHLVERKGHHLIIEAMKSLPDYDLWVIGGGEEMANLKSLVTSSGLESQVKLTGALEPPQVKDYFQAADAMILASSREGWANVLLESMACGTPVVATNVWGTPEVVATPEAGVLMSERSVKGVAQGVETLFRSYPDRSLTRRYAEQFSWQPTSEGQLILFQSIVERTA